MNNARLRTLLHISLRGTRTCGTLCARRTWRNNARSRKSCIIACCAIVERRCVLRKISAYLIKHIVTAWRQKYQHQAAAASKSGNRRQAYVYQAAASQRARSVTRRTRVSYRALNSNIAARGSGRAARDSSAHIEHNRSRIRRTHRRTRCGAWHLNVSA